MHCRIVSADTEGDCSEDVYLIKKGLLGFLSGNFLAHFGNLRGASRGRRGASWGVLGELPEASGGVWEAF